MRVGHRSCWPGKRVRMKLTDGTVLFGRFLEKKGEWITLEVNGEKKRYWAGKVQGLQIYKKQFATQ